MTNTFYPDFNDKVFWGFVSHFRFWMIFDGGELKRLKRSNNGYLDSKSIERIANNYSVRRGIKKTKQQNCNRTSEEWFAHSINEFDSMKITTLEERAKWCANLAYIAREKGITRGMQASAITKFLWFRCQERWTIFDNLVASAVKANGKNSVERMIKYFKILSNFGFVEHANNIDNTLKRNGFGCLHGGRVIDSYLLLNSSKDDWISNTMLDCYWFLENLPKDVSNNVVRVGNRIPRGIESLVRGK